MPLGISGFPRSPEELANTILEAYPIPPPWSSTGAVDHFATEIARTYFHLLHTGISDLKPFFCLEVARLVNDVLLQDLKDSHGSFMAATGILKQAGLAAVEEFPVEFMEEEFYKTAHGGSVVELAKFLREHWK